MITTNSDENRKVFDSVYGFISFPKEIWEFIDSPHFQRLRNIKQLGCLSWVFPGAVHTRFEHCLGTGHLAQQYITKIIEKHNSEKINKKVFESYYKVDETNRHKSVKDEAIFIVTLAGILHDIGHGPYSHLFDSKVIDEPINGQKWEHEIASLCLIDSLYQYVAAQKNDQRDREWLKSTKNRVKALIIGKITEPDYEEQEDGSFKKIGKKEVTNLQAGFTDIFKQQLTIRPWEFQLISNRITGIDVDKLDYFRRDAFYVGAKNIYIDHQLLMNETLILEDQKKSIPETTNEDDDQSERYRLCYPEKYSDKVYDIYYSRYKLYKTYYMSLKANGVDMMLAEILKLADSRFDFKKACRDLLNGDCTRYIRLTDSILEKIEDAYDEVRQKQDRNEIQQKSYEAGVLLQKLKRRQIYDFIKQYHMSLSFKEIQKGEYHKARKQLKQFINEQNSVKRQKEICIQLTEIGFGIKDRNPFEECKFFDKARETKQIEVDNEKSFSMLKPDGVIEISIRIYMKERIKNPTAREKKMKTELEEELKIAIQKKVGKKLTSGTGGTMHNRTPSRQHMNAEAEETRKEIRGDNDISKNF